MTRETDLTLDDGRTLHVYDVGARDSGSLAVVWHHGTPNTGAPPEPLFAAADRLGIRWVSYDRPGYGGSTPHHGRNLASGAADVATITTALDINRFATVGHSGGGPHALACGALLPERVLGVVSLAGLAPFSADRLDWFAGMAASGVASLQAATRGRAAKALYEASGVEYHPEFIPADLIALSGEWSWLGEVVRRGMEAGTDGLIDDDIAYVSPWGCDPTQLLAPTLLLHGGRDRVVPSSHSEWLARNCPSAEMRLCADEGHVSILNSAAAALGWLRTLADQG